MLVIPSGILHIVLVEMKPGQEGRAEEVFDRLSKLGEECGGVEAGILFWQIKRSLKLDFKKNVAFIEIGVFRDDAAVLAFRQHLAHREFVDKLFKNTSNWWLGNAPTEEESPLVTFERV